MRVKGEISLKKINRNDDDFRYLGDEEIFIYILKNTNKKLSYMAKRILLPGISQTK